MAQDNQQLGNRMEGNHLEEGNHLQEGNLQVDILLGEVNLQVDIHQVEDIQQVGSPGGDIVEEDNRVEDMIQVGRGNQLQTQQDLKAGLCQ